jgi:tetratricopeptide (TPR) repeat protein
MVMGPGVRGNEFEEFWKEVLFRDFARFLTFEQSSGFAYPRWYVEGIASVMGATVIDRNSVSVGRLSSFARFTDAYGILKIIDVLQNREGNVFAKFEERLYGTSWLLTHYLLIHGLANNRELVDKTQDYLRRYHEGQDSLAAFKEVFDPLDEFDRVIASYSRQSRRPVLNLTKPEISLQMTKHAISETEKDYVIGELLYSLGQEDLALEYLSRSDATLEHSGEALSLEAVILNHDATTADLASKSAEEADGIANLSARALANLAQYEVISYRRLKEAGEEAEASVRLERAKEYAESSLAKDGTEFDALWYTAGILIENDQLEEGLEMLVAAWNVHAVGYSVRLQIINLLLRLGDVESAKPIVRSLIGAIDDPQTSQRLAELAAQLENGEVDLSILDEISSPIF